MAAEILALAGAGMLDTLLRAIVTAVNSDGSVLVTRETADSKILVCDRLVTGAEGVLLAPDDVVLCYATPGSDRGVVLGRIGYSHGSADDDAPGQGTAGRGGSEESHNVMLLEAKQEITLRVGEASITIRADGKILIKGKDLVSHAQRMNRIKGGSVAIN